MYGFWFSGGLISGSLVGSLKHIFIEMQEFGGRPVIQLNFFGFD